MINIPIYNRETKRRGSHRRRRRRNGQRQGDYNIKSRSLRSKNTNGTYYNNIIIYRNTMTPAKYLFVSNYPAVAGMFPIQYSSTEGRLRNNFN